ncbi:MAG: RdgB/HAM1 family non-canonical purine NTP pyrophosphatase [Hyphomicrobiaceae bacterium]
MTRSLQPGTRLVIASHNEGKLREISELLLPFDIQVVSAGDLGLPEPDETETTFAGNARLKSVAAATASGFPALADDSGLEVAALDGAPGIYSARWAGPAKDFGVAMAKVEEALGAKGARTAGARRANFTAVLSLAWPDGHSDEFEGKVFGTLVWPPRGGNGFGYDPMFRPDGHDQTFGEMQPAAKHAISHRAVAFAKFLGACLG